MSRTPGQGGAGGDDPVSSAAQQLRERNEAQEKEIAELNGTINMLRKEIKEMVEFRTEDENEELIRQERDKAEAAERKVEELERKLAEAPDGSNNAEDVLNLQQALEAQRQQVKFSQAEYEQQLAQLSGVQHRAQEQDQEIEHLSATVQQLQSQLAQQRQAGELAQQRFTGQNNKALEEALARARSESEKANELQKQVSRLEAETRRQQRDQNQSASAGPPPDANRTSQQAAQTAKENEELKRTLSVVLDQLQQKIDAEAGPEAGADYQRESSQLRNELQAALEENKRLMDTNAFMNPNAMKHYKQTISKYEHLRHKTTQDVQKYRQLAAKFKEMRGRLGQKDKELAGIRTQLHQSAADRNDKETELEKLRQDYNALGKQMGKLSAQVARSHPLKSKRVGQLKKLKEDYETLVNQFSTLKKETSQKEQALQTLVGQLTKEKNADRQKLRDVRRRLREQRGFIVAYLEKQMHMLNNENATSLEVLREFLAREERAAAARRGVQAPGGMGTPKPAAENGFDELIERSRDADQWFEKGMRAAGTQPSRPTGRNSGQPLRELSQNGGRLDGKSNGLGSSVTPGGGLFKTTPSVDSGVPSRKRLEETTTKSYTYTSNGPSKSASNGFLSKPFQSSFTGLGTTSSYKPTFSTSGLSAGLGSSSFNARPAPQAAPSVSESVYSLHAKAQTLNEDMKRKHNDTVSQFKASLEARHRKNQQAINTPLGTSTVRVY